MAVKKYELGEITTIVNGATPSTICPQYYDGNIVWITPKDLSEQQTKYIIHSSRNITTDGYNSCSTQMIPPYNILLTSRAPIGLIAINKVECCTNQGFKNIIINKDYVDVEYLYYYLKYHIKEIEAFGTGTTFKEVSKKSLEHYTLILPKLNIQKSIIQILTCIDDKIAINKQINENLEALARQLYNYWFVQFDFPDENGRPYKSSGGKMVWNDRLKQEIPKGWEIVQMKDVIDIKSGFPFHSNTYLPIGKYKIITIKNVQDGYIDINDTDFIDRLPYRIPNYCVLSKGDSLISLTGNVGRVGRIYADNLLLNQRVGYIDCKNGFDNWAYLYMTTEQVRKQIEKLGIGSAQSNVSPIQIGKIKMLLPVHGILLDFEQRVKSILQQAMYCREENLSLTKQRNELLPLLMNGQASVNSTLP